MVICPKCGSKKIKEIKIDADVSSAPDPKLAKALMKTVPFYECEDCGEKFVNIVDLLAFGFMYAQLRELVDKLFDHVDVGELKKF